MTGTDGERESGKSQLIVDLIMMTIYIYIYIYNIFANLNILQHSNKDLDLLNYV